MDKIIVVKVGSAVLTHENGVNGVSIRALCKEIDNLNVAGYRVALVSSGAEAAGKQMFLNFNRGKAISSNIEVNKRANAALGQSELIKIYSNHLADIGSDLRPAQILLAKEAFANRNRYINLRETLLALMRKNILPIINNNDVVHDKDLEFVDNDQLACYVAGQLDAQRLILVSDIDGIYSKNPKVYDDAKIITTLSANSTEWPKIEVDMRASSNGGAKSKLDAFKLMSSFGISCSLVKLSSQPFLQEAIRRSSGTHLTCIARDSNSISNYKKWLLVGAHNAGILVVSALGADAIKRQANRASLLSIGLESVIGDFDAEEIVTVRNENYEFLAIGKSLFSSLELRRVYKKRDEMVVHADAMANLETEKFDKNDAAIIRATIDKLKKQGYALSENSVGIVVLSLRNAENVAREVYTALDGEAKEVYLLSKKISKLFRSFTVEEGILFILFQKIIHSPSEQN